MNVLLESAPGVGKTTVARELVRHLRGAGLLVAGFLTTEVREGDRRVGFEIETTSGSRRLLAHADLPGPPRVGRYGVDLAAIDQVALPALEGAADVAVVDELGSMELASLAFRDAIQALFDVPRPVVATVHARRHAFTDRLKRRDDVQVIRVTRGNRDHLPEQLASRLGTRR